MTNQFSDATKMVFPPNDLSHLSDEEFNALAPQGYHATGTAEPLSPAAQSVMDAYRSTHLSINNLAAALRAAVAHTQQHRGLGVWECDADELLAIAAELEEQ
jgi:hypothetical protein